MSTIFNAAPMPYLRGIRDASRGVNVKDPEQLPTHLPHFFIYAAEGPTEPTYCADGSASTIFGSKTFDSRYPYYNHQTVCAQVVSGEGNGIFLQRVIPNDAGPKARILLSLDVLAKDVPLYQRAADGSYLLDSNGQKIQVPVSPGPQVTSGHQLKWVVNSWGSGGSTEDFGQVSQRTGSLVDGVNESTLYPIMEFEVNFVGAYGNDIGLRLVAPNTNNDFALDSDAAAAIKSYIYRLAILRRDGPASSPFIVDTNAGDQWFEFSTADKPIDTRRDIDYSFDRLIDAYQDMSAPGQETPIYGPFGRAHLYRSNLEEVLEMVGALEAPFGTLPELTLDGSSEYLHAVNLFSATNYDGVPYYSVDLLGPLNGGIRFGESSQVYAAGASDGTMSNAAFDLLVRDQLTNYGYGEYPMLNWAKYPVSAYYDTGFELDTKYAFFNIIARRKDTAVTLGTHVVGEDQLTASEESSTALSLFNMARNFPESTLYGTAVVRAVICGQSGKLIGSNYRDFLPLTIELARKRAAYMGSGNGRWRSTAAYDQTPNNQMTSFTNVNTHWKPETQRYRDWDNGLVWVEDYDRSSKFFPAIQTVYNDDTSVLNADVNMWIAVDLEKVAQRSWRDMTGNSKLSDEQFLERSDENISNAVRGRYDERAIIEPRTYFTAADKQRGYSWSCEITMRVGSLRTAGSFTIVAKRLTDGNAEG